MTSIVSGGALNSTQTKLTGEISYYTTVCRRTVGNENQEKTKYDTIRDALIS